MEIFLFLLFFNIIQIKGKDESLVTHYQLNDFETIYSSQNFIIETNKISIAYFDLIDRNSVVYISKDYQKFITEKDERISGKFYTIEPNTKYYVRNSLYFSPSVFKRYLFPLDLSNDEIIISEEKPINYLYLEKNKIYILNFKENSRKKMIALSRKTINSKVKIKSDNKEIELNQNSLYYKNEEKFKGQLTLEVKENDAFIEFLSDIKENNDYKILEDIQLISYELISETTMVVFPYTQKDFEIHLFSDEPFKLSFSYGFSNDKNYYYNSISNVKIDSPKDDNGYISEFILQKIFNNITPLENEFFSFVIKIEKKNEQKIKLTYGQVSEIDLLLDEKVDKSYCEKVIKNIKDILDIYVYTDIAQSPPKIQGDSNYHHKEINLKQEIEKISIINRNFYEFYQDLKMILDSVKDLHFNIFAKETPKLNLLYKYSASLPFNFVIKELNNEYRVYIKKNNFLQNYDSTTQNFINAHFNIPLKTINDQDPFDYIQNWGKFRKTKNKHSQFTRILKHISNFYLSDYPLNYSDITFNEYEFDDNKLLRIPYFINNKIKSNNKSFNNYFLNILENSDSSLEIPPYEEIEEDYLTLKNGKKIILKLGSDNIKWDILYNEKRKTIKCRFDQENKVNVLYQNTFSLDTYKGIGTILKCAKLFYNNNYPIIIIESENGGGKVLLQAIMSQVLQTRILNRGYFSYKSNSISEKYFKQKTFNAIDPLNCRIINSYNDINLYDDFYDKQSIIHTRTSPIDLVPFYYREALRNFREQYENNKNIKKPTDIIIFTDSYSYSATSLFIKGYQNSGGAVLVGYFGNPKIKGIDLFDASQSPSQVEKLEKTNMYKELENLGINIMGVTTGETYSFYQKDVNGQIPREYSFDPVDYRVNIYSNYNDDLYKKFIQEGLKIHEKFNKNNFCNSKNEKLLLHDDNCKNIKGYDYAHGFILVNILFATGTVVKHGINEHLALQGNLSFVLVIKTQTCGQSTTGTFSFDDKIIRIHL